MRILYDLINLIASLLGARFGFGRRYTEIFRYDDGGWAEIQHCGSVSHGSWISYRKDSTVRWVRHFRFNKKSGVDRIWFDNKKLKHEKHYINDRLHGQWKEWYESGQLKHYIRFKYGKVHGVEERYNENGHITTRGYSENGNSWDGTFPVTVADDDGTAEDAVFAYKKGKIIRQWSPPFCWDEIAEYSYTSKE